MTANTRIAINTLATYGRSMYGVLCGIFSARWVLEALGQEDFGLYSVVGGMAIFLGFLNIQFGGAISRFYAYSIGRSKIAENRNDGLEDCRIWFTIALLIHTFLPLILVTVGLPLGECAIKYGWVVIPPSRVHACIWVWRIVCLSTFISMVNVPFQAMYIAKQFIAELTIYSFLQTTAKTCFIYYMTTCSRDWIIPYALVVAGIGIVAQLLICFRAVIVFPECRVVSVALKRLSRIKEIASYAVWTAIGGVGYVASHQCMGILVNNFFGARAVAGFGVSQTVSGEAASLTGALQGAFQPAIATAFGSGDLEGMRKMAFRVCKFGTLLTLMFAIPMALEMEELLFLWLRNPPPLAAPMCLCTLAFIVLEKLTCGHITAVNATGRIARFQLLRGLLRCTVLPLALISACLGLGPIVAMLSLPVSVVLVDIGDVFMARSRVHMRVSAWFSSVVVPNAIIATVSFLVGLGPRFFMPSSFLRLVVTTGCALLSIIVMSWNFVLSLEERQQVKLKILQKVSRHKIS